MKKIIKGFALLAGLVAFVAAEGNDSCGAAQSVADKCMENKDKESCEKDKACAFSTVINTKTNKAVSVCMANTLTNSKDLSNEDLQGLGITVYKKSSERREVEGEWRGYEGRGYASENPDYSRQSFGSYGANERDMGGFGNHTVNEQYLGESDDDTGED